MTVKKRQNGDGNVRRLASGRWQARFTGPDGVTRSAGRTFDAKQDATAWLKRQVRDVELDEWSAPTAPSASPRLRDYAEAWMTDRVLKPRTRSQYRRLLDGDLLPTLGDVRVDRLSPATVRTWWSNLEPSRPVWNEHAYSLLRAIMTTAYREALIDANPCRLERTKSKRKITTKVATADELGIILRRLPERYRAMVLLATWCALRFGELTELRRGDLDVYAGTVTVARGVVRVDGEVLVGSPKSEAGSRTVAIPPHLLGDLEDHLKRHVGAAQTSLLFPAASGGHMAPSALYRVWYPARKAAGRDDLRFHDLRHTGATLAAQAGATLADLMARVGHSTPAAALRYQHAAAGRDQLIAAALSDFATVGAPRLKAVR